MSNSTFIEEYHFKKSYWQERYEELREKYNQLIKSKDALLEWAKEQKTLMQLGGHVSIDDVIDKLNSF